MLLYKKARLLSGLLVCMLTLSIASAKGTDFPKYMVFASDPQFPWTESSDNGEDERSGEKYSRSRFLIESQYSSIADFRRSVSTDPRQVPVMINGDMTAYGHGGERSTVRSILDEQLAGIYDYGLGNHDYVGNVDDCLLNNCAAGSVIDLKERYWGKVASMDLGLRSSGLGKTFYGSLAYSKQFGDVHVVQLNNEPTHSSSFSSGFLLSPTNFEITPALDWLEQDLKKARAQDKIIILNMHQVYDWKGSEEQISRFRQMIEKYKVTAVFGGHDHWGAGLYPQSRVDETFGEVPVYLSGSASQKTYLIAGFTEDRKSLGVSIIRDGNWAGSDIDTYVTVNR
jgi:hypothetical protein